MKLTVKKIKGCFVYVLIFSYLNSWDFSLFFRQRRNNIQKLKLDKCHEKIQVR